MEALEEARGLASAAAAATSPSREGKWLRGVNEATSAACAQGCWDALVRDGSLTIAVQSDSHRAITTSFALRNLESLLYHNVPGGKHRMIT